VTSLVLIVLMALWRPIPAPVWTVAGAGAIVLWALFAIGWGMVLLSTFLINHFELFGLEQLWRELRGIPAAGPQFRQPLFYRWVRHPLYFGFILAFWATPRMTVGHLLLALGMTIYILIAIRLEERDLLASIGAPYADYRRRDRPPQRHQHDQDETRHGDIDAAFERQRHHPSPGRLEAAPRHHAVLHAEQHDQRNIDCQRDVLRGRRARIDRARHDEIADETDEIKEGRQEQQIYRQSYKHLGVARHHRSPGRRKPTRRCGADVTTICRDAIG
jgi:protein-S-isoprenylcysteine O-methyltransferase Ste14